MTRFSLLTRGWIWEGKSVTYVPCYILYILNWTYLILLSYYLVYFICIIELLFHLILFETIYCTISLYDLYELIFCANANVIFHSDIYYMYALLSYMLWARQPLLCYYVLLIVDRCHICRTFPQSALPSSQQDIKLLSLSTCGNSHPKLTICPPKTPISQLHLSPRMLSN